MPINPVTVTTSTVVARRSGFTYDIPAVVSHDAGTATPGTVYQVSSKLQAETYFGSNTDMYKAICNILNQGVTTVYAVPASASTVEAYNACYDVLKAKNVDLVYLPGIEATASRTASGTVLYNHIRKCEANNWITVLWATTDTLGTGAALNTALGTITDENHAQSDNVMLVIASNPGNEFDIGGAVAGVVCTTRQWHKLMYKSIASVDVDEMKPSDVDIVESNQANAIIRVRGQWVLSNGFSLSGSTSKKFFDITRTARLMEDMFKEALQWAEIVGEIPYNEEGLKIVKGILARECASLVTAGALTGFTIDMPTMDTISDEDRANRILKNVVVTAQLAGSIQTFSINLTLEI